MVHKDFSTSREALFIWAVRAEIWSAVEMTSHLNFIYIFVCSRHDLAHRLLFY